jgi:hypothetical protein
VVVKVRFFTLKIDVDNPQSASIEDMNAALIVEPMRQYPKLLELYCFGCMGPIAVSPRPEVLKIVERLHKCGHPPLLPRRPSEPQSY